MKWAGWVLALAAAMAAVGCSEDEDRGADEGDDPLPPAEPVTPELSSGFDITSLTTGTFWDAAELLDFDDNQRIDRADLALLEEAMASSTADDSPEFDLNQDGELDERDARLMRILVGSVTPRTDAAISALADAKDSAADGEAPEDLTQLAVDYDQDDDQDGDDIRFLANVMRSDPVGQFDFDGSGAIGFNDVAIVGKALATAADGADLSQYDVTADGATDDADLMLLAELAVNVSTIHFGMLDFNMDEAIDLSDYCTLVEGPDTPNFYHFIMPPDAADAAFAASPPTTAICRADGVSQFAFPPDLTTDLRMVVLPDNLSLSEVPALPPDYTPLGAPPPPDTALFVFSEGVTDMPVTSLSMPLAVGEPWSASPQIQVGGGGLPADGLLATPGGTMPLGPDVSGTTGVAPQGGGADSVTIGYSTQEIEILEALIHADESAQARLFAEAMGNAMATYDGIINSPCPCELDAMTRAEIVRDLIRMKNCLKAIEAAAQAALNAAQRDHQGITRDHVYASRLAAFQWQWLSDTMVEAEWMNVIALVLETMYDGATEGLPGALTSAVGNLIEEIEKDLTDDSSWLDAPEGLDSVPQSLLNGVSLSEANGLLATDALGASLEAIFEKGVKGMNPAQFTRELISGFRANWGDFEAPGIEDFVKNLLKMIPSLYLNHVKAAAFAQEATASEKANIYYESTLTVGGWQNLVEAMGGGADDAQQKLLDLLAAFEADGCGSTMSDSDPCQPALAAATANAETQLRTDMDAANAQINSALDGLSSGDAAFDCFNGEHSAARDRNTFNQFDQAAQIVNQVGEVDAESISTELEIAMREAAAEREAAMQAWRAQCLAAILQGNANDDAVWQGVVAGLAAKQRAVDDYEAALGAAMRAYVACSSDGGGGCAGTMTGGSASWSAAAACLQCAPSITLQCPDEPPLVQICTGAYMSGDQCQALVTGLITDPTGDDIYSTSTTAAGNPGPDNDITGFTGVIGEFTQGLVDTIFNLSVYECGVTAGGITTVCPPTPLDVPPGNVIMVASVLEGDLPTSDAVPAPTLYYTYAVVFDEDDDPVTNFQFVDPYDWDYFRDTDRWYQLNYNPVSSTWSIAVTQWDGAQAQPIASGARAVMMGNTLVWFIPASELTAANPPYRVTAFRHDGTYAAAASAGDVNGANPTEPLTPLATPAIVVAGP